LFINTQTYVKRTRRASDATSRQIGRKSEMIPTSLDPW